jgi:hypothetical protein
MTGVVQTRVWRILHHDCFYPYHFKKVQHLLPGDHAHRVQFCERKQPWLHTMHDILFMDETQFKWDSITNIKIHTLEHKKIREVAECHFQH